MSNYRGSRGGPRNYPDSHDDRVSGSGREILYNSRGRGSYSRGSFSQGGRTNYNNDNFRDGDFGAAAFHQQGDNMRKYGNKAKSNHKPHRGGNNHYKPPRAPGPRAHIDNDDDAMGDDTQPGPSHGRRFSPYGGRTRGGRGGSRGVDSDRNQRGSWQRGGYSRGGRGNRGGGGYSSSNSFRPYTGGPSAWFKIMIPHGRKESKDFLLKSLLNISEVPFIPQQFHHEGNQAVFHIQDSAAATALRAASRRITNTQGIKLVVIVTSSRQPGGSSSLNPLVVEKLKVCMSARYDPATKSMNLSSLEADADLNREDVRLAFAKMSVAREVLKVINENIPELESLDLTRNNLANLSMLGDLAEKAPNITRLNLGNNSLKHEGDLEIISKLPLVELCLDGNPLCDKFNNEAIYVSAIRKRFPKVLRLDGHDLPPPITFDLDTVVKFPESQGSHFGTNEQVKSLVCQFVQQYVGLFDSENRQALLDAYHEEAIFSLITYKNMAIAQWQPPLSPYAEYSRNLMRIGTDPDRRMRLMKQGRLAIVAQLSEMPTTEHDPSSFLVDIIHLSSSMLIFSVQGLFREPDSDSDVNRQYIRSFSRVFVTIPQGTGISILNEEFMVTNATVEQKKKIFKSRMEPTNSIPAVAAVSPAAGALAPADQQQLTQQFSTQSGMNMEWSAKCLQENNWNYELSAKVFTELHAKGNIPPEAFSRPS